MLALPRGEVTPASLSTVQADPPSTPPGPRLWAIIQPPSPAQPGISRRIPWCIALRMADQRPGEAIPASQFSALEDLWPALPGH